MGYGSEKMYMEKRGLGGLYLIYGKTDKFPSLTLSKSTEFSYSFSVFHQVPGDSNI